MLRISFANQKGGVGKTTVTLGFAEAAFLNSKRVLVVDCDPQANVSTGLGIEQGSNYKTIVDVLRDEVEITASNKSQFIQASTWNTLFDEIDLTNGAVPCIDVLASNGMLSSIEALLATDPVGACDRLDLGLKNIADDYDFIFFDCPPSMGLLTINALYASDNVIIVSGPSAWSSDGVSIFTNNVERIARRLGGRPSICSILVNNVSRTRDAKFWFNEISENNNESDIKVQSISSRAAIAEAGAMSQPISALGKRDGAQIAKQEFLDAFQNIFDVSNEGKKIKLVNY